MALGYLLHRFGYRIVMFFSRWYVGSLRVIMRSAVNTLESLDRVFALQVTVRNLFQPLYQDHTVVGHLFGFLFRAGRIAIGGSMYLLLIIIAAIAYLLWAMIPVAIVYRGFLI